MKTFKEGQKVRVVTGYVGVPNLFAEGFTPLAGMEGKVEESPTMPEAEEDREPEEFWNQYVVDFGNGRWDTFTPDELEAV